MVHSKKVGVFVYGDIGRSPRMNNHAEQLSQNYEVYLMGYLQSAPRSSVTDNDHIHLVDLSINGLGIVRRKSFYLYALIRIVLQILQIIYMLAWKHRGLDFVLIQNPPSIPNLFAIWLASFVARYKIYIDFHNYGYTILQLKVKNRIVNLVAQKYEKFFGKRCDKAFCVSNAMKEDLSENWGIEATTLYDRPRKNCCNASVSRQKFFKKYGLGIPAEDDLLVVSSTSWTKDEDFSILLNALINYEESSNKQRIRAYITGKGPEKAYYLEKISKLKQNWTKVSVQTVWLEADDYPVLLSLCHLGICLHYSSSGLDLPMKVIDMFGVGIPVLAIDFKALPELVHHGKNGYIFKNQTQLCQQLSQLSTSAAKLNRLKEGAQLEKEHTWDLQWSTKFPK